MPPRSKTANHVFSTNSRVLKDLLTQYRNTFYAFCELINNSIQANSNRIDIKIDYAGNELSASPIKSIVIKDNGNGVGLSDFDKKILEIGTDVKKGGQGVGRFAALQIGSNVEIETVGYDDELKSYTKINLPINSAHFDNKKLVDLKFPAKEEILKSKHKTYYEVTIKNLYHSKNEKIARKNIIAKELLPDNIRLSIFEQYPYEVFNNTVQFVVNGDKLEKSEFIFETPHYKKESFVDIQGNAHDVEFFFYRIKLNDNRAKVFFQVENAGLKSVAITYSYSSEWFTSDMGSWYIYVESPFFTYDLFKNIDMDELGDEGIDKLKLFAKNVITDFFISINKRFEKFTQQLKDAYPAYIDSKNVASDTQRIVFEQFAYIAEQKYKLIEKDNRLRELIYPLMERAIADGNIVEILDTLLKTDKEVTDKFKSLLDITDLESVVHFNTDIAKKLEFLDFLHELTYGDISDYVLERKQLHKIVEKELWLFGEAYNGLPNILWSDKKLLKIFEEIRQEYMNYEPRKEDENLIELKDEQLNDITDLFFTNERPQDDGSREYMIVELKAPKCKISQKELNQIDKYAYAVQTKSSIPKHKARYKLLLISSELSGFAKSKVEAASLNYQVPFLYERKKDSNIEIHVMSWSELIQIQRKKLNYLSKQLKIKDKSVKEKFEEEYPHLINHKMRVVLKKIS